jgi:hypothetical protein
MTKVNLLISKSEAQARLSTRILQQKTHTQMKILNKTRVVRKVGSNTSVPFTMSCLILRWQHDITPLRSLKVIFKYLEVVS